MPFCLHWLALGFHFASHSILFWLFLLPQPRERGHNRRGRGSSWWGGARIGSRDSSKGNLEMDTSTSPSRQEEKSGSHMAPTIHSDLEDIWIWGCKVEWVEDEIGLQNNFEGHSNVQIPASIRKDDQSPDASRKLPFETCPEPMELCLKEEQMQLDFELRRDVADLLFSMEQMDAKLDLLLTLCSRSMASQPAQDPDLPSATIPDIPILLDSLRTGFRLDMAYSLISADLPFNVFIILLPIASF